MKVCVPIEQDQGMSSQVYSHFGSAPGYLIVDTETESCRFVPNRNPHHSHGMCNPLASLAGEKLDAVVVGGIGLGALRKLRTAKHKVFLADRQSVREVVDAFAAGELRRVTSDIACGHRGRGPHGRGREGCAGSSTGFGQGGGNRRRSRGGKLARKTD